MSAEQEFQRELRALFAEELHDGVDLLSTGLLALENNSGGTAPADRVRELFRVAHSLKGAAHAAAVPEAVAIADRLESALAEIRDGASPLDSALITHLLAETDVLAELGGGLSASATAEEPVSVIAAGIAAASAIPEADRAQETTGSGIRVAVDKVDAVLGHAGEGLAAARRLQEIAAAAAQTAADVESARARLQFARRAGRTGAVAEEIDTLLDDATAAAARVARTIQGTARELHHTSSAIADAAQQLRTRPFADACNGLQRVVRDVAATTGKQATFRVLGGDVEVDRAIVTGLREPLRHLVRNAVDHGLESPADRRAAGKPAAGLVEVNARLEGSALRITVRDDGGGLDMVQLRAAAVREGVPLPDDDMELAFMPGLSTRAEVTDISGRGVGLDAVRGRLEQLGGRVEVASRPGAGTEVALMTPVMLAVVHVLLVQAGGEIVAMPLSTVETVAQVPRDSVQELGGDQMLELQGRSARVVWLAGALGFDDGGSPVSAAVLSLIVPSGGDTFLVADSLLDEVEVGVHPVPERVAGTPGVLGVATLGSGRTVMVVNPAALGRQPDRLPAASRPEAPVAPTRILLAEDTITTRALERSILEAAGYSVAVAVDGADAWQQLQTDGADLVVSDIDMPKMDGIELCRRIRSSPTLRELPVVLVTSLDSDTDRRRGLEAGADAYVVKAGLQQGTLLDALARLL